MEIFPVLPNAPIMEALIDIRVELPKEIDLDYLETYHNNIKNQFPEKQKRTSIEAGIHFSPKGQSKITASGGPDGFLFQSKDKKKIVQARMDGFTFNKLKPYENWDVFYSEAQELWNLYFSLASPVKITRIALRYINKILLPLPFSDFKEYLLTIPEISAKLPQGLAHFLMRLIISKVEIQATGIITQTMEPPNQYQKLPIIFDIDVVKEYSQVEFNQIWEDFKKLRQFKNEIFFYSITEKTKELFS